MVALVAVVALMENLVAFKALVALMALVANFNFQPIQIPSCSSLFSGSFSTPSNPVIQQFYCLAITSTEVCELFVVVYRMSWMPGNS